MASNAQPGTLYRAMLDDPVKLATIECAVCGAYVEVYREGTSSDEAGDCWKVRDAELCRHPPLDRCPQARLEVTFPDEIP